MYKRKFLLIILATFGSSTSFGIDYGLSILGGFLQQPTSQFFHTGYGAEFVISSKKETLGIRAIYFERPKFISQGFEDQDRGYAALLSSTFWQKDKYFLLGGVGLGRFEGYTKPLDGTSSLKSRSFGITGMNVWTQAGRNFGKYRVSLMHWAHIGYAGKEQFSAVVAWPFNVFGVALGWIT